MNVIAKQGRLFFVVGPSGVGKDTLIAGAIAADPNLIWARRCITRPESAGGEPFEGLTETQFDLRLQADAFVLHWTAHGLRYGVPYRAISPLLQGRDVLLNGSRGAISQAQAVFADMRIINITAPNDFLAQRLAARGRESASEIALRLERASFALPTGIFAIDVVNDSAPEIGVARLLQAIKGYRCSR